MIMPTSSLHYSMDSSEHGERATSRTTLVTKVTSALSNGRTERRPNALINGIPNCTMIQVRTWQFKERLTGTNLPVSMEDAYMCGNDSLAQEARTGIHDDCFLASDTDYGTWQDSAVDKPRMSNHSTFTIFGGEMCNPGSNRNDCPIALQ